MEKLLLLHGALGSKSQLEALRELLDKDYDVYSFNFSGHGGEPFNETFSIAQFSEELHDFIKTNNLESVSLFGYSMGGYVALYFAQFYPEKVKKIITLGTKFYWTEAISLKEVERLNPDIIEEKIPKFAEILKNRHQPNDWKLVLTKTAQMMTKMGVENPLQSADFLTINIPTICLIGENDEMVTIEETADVYRTLPNGAFYSIPNTKHPIEQVDLTILKDKINHFLTS
jgi:pimeloyl-ACP methyl ester carboxylesterase